MRGIKMIENDYEFVYLAQENDEFAQEYLINKYKYIIDILVSKHFASIRSLKIEKMIYITLVYLAFLKQ